MMMLVRGFLFSVVGAFVRKGLESGKMALHLAAAADTVVVAVVVVEVGVLVVVVAVVGHDDVVAVAMMVACW